MENQKKIGRKFFTKPSLTKQSMSKECDINHIMKRYQTNGILPDMIKQNPQYGDFSRVPDYQTALNTVQKAQEQFENLPARIRDRFQNEPAQFLEFATNKKNLPEMVQMGLAILKPETPKTEKPASAEKPTKTENQKIETQQSQK